MNDSDYILLEGVVVSNDDEYGGNRIKVRLGNTYDGDKNDNQLPYCSPLLPKLIHIIPKVGELVLIVLQKQNSSESNRFYLGPLLSQPYNYKHELADTAVTLLKNTKKKPDTHPNRNPKNIGTIPDIEDIAIIGRENTDIILKDDEIRIRCGLKKDPNGTFNNKLNFNEVSPAFIQMRWEKRNDPKNNDEYYSSINIFADKINLLSRHGDKSFGVIDSKKMVSGEMMDTILKNAHPIVYGDYLVELLRQILNVINTHTHPYSMLPPASNGDMINLLNTNLNDILSKSVSVN